MQFVLFTELVDVGVELGNKLNIETGIFMDGGCGHLLDQHFSDLVPEYFVQQALIQ